MRNPILFGSSVCMTLSTIVCSVALRYKVNKFLLFLYLFGDFTSMWNHGTHSMIARRVDRTVMAVGACIDLYYITDLRRLLFLMASISCYFISKTCKTEEMRISWHTNAHLWVSILHNDQLANTE